MNELKRELFETQGKITKYNHKRKREDAVQELRIGLVGTGAIIDFCRSVAEKYGIKAYYKSETGGTRWN